VSETPRPGTDQRQLLLTLGLAAVLVLALGVGFVAGFLTGHGRAGAGDGDGARAIDHAGHAAAAPVPGPRADAAPPAAGDAAQGGHGHPAAGGGDGGSGACVYELPVKDQWVLAGMTCNCNEAPCNRTPLLSCHCETAHQMKSLTKQLIVEGMGAEGIGAELEKRWGPGILPARGAVR
jgi:hypothetical protein